MDTLAGQASDTAYDSPLLQGLNEPQKQAVLHESGPVLIFAGAGSGKTNALTKRIAYLIRERFVRPYNIIAVTFTNKAANEMKERIGRLIGEVGRDLWAGTFHSICARMLRERGKLIGLDRKFVIYDDDDQVSLVKECLHELNVDDKQFAPRAILSQISHFKEKLITADKIPTGNVRTPFDKVVARVYPKYQQKLTMANALDFDDLIMKSVELLQDSEEARNHYQERFHYVHCDEFQDVNDSQYKLLSLLAAKHKNICVVGDDDQSIYSFRGANVDIILNFEKDFPDATIIKLEQNYRSTKTILDAAYHVVKNNSGRADKRLWTDNIEGEQITLVEADNEVEEAVAIIKVIREEILRQDRHYSDFAILYRANHQSRAIEDQLVNHRIPYKIVGGLRFYERKEIKDVIAYLRIVMNPYDSISMRRVINVPARAIGASTVDKLSEFAVDREIGFWDACRRAAEIDVAPRTRHNVNAFVKMIEYLGEQANRQTVSQLIPNILDTVGYIEELRKDRTPEAESRVENVGELVSVAKDFEAGGGDDGDISLSAFLEQISLVADIDRLDDSTDAVTLMTLHSAKGLEFPVVFLTGMEESIFPHMRSMSDKAQMEEERRLCYVGITRAQTELFLTYAGARTTFGQTRRNPVSRFLVEIPQSLFLATSTRRPSMQRYAPTLAPGSNRPQSQTAPTWDDLARRAAVRQSEKPLSSNPYKVGQKVRSEKFGTGTIVSLEGDTIINVAFPAPIGIKKLDTNFAKLDKV
jgi:DNA helicase-2/ATP-dependent DNA helicase PcrA